MSSIPTTTTAASKTAVFEKVQQVAGQRRKQPPVHNARGKHQITSDKKRKRHKPMVVPPLIGATKAKQEAWLDFSRKNQLLFLRSDILNLPSLQDAKMDLATAQKILDEFLDRQGELLVEQQLALFPNHCYLRSEALFSELSEITSSAVKVWVKFPKGGKWVYHTAPGVLNDEPGLIIFDPWFSKTILDASQWVKSVSDFPDLPHQIFVTSSNWGYTNKGKTWTFVHSSDLLNRPSFRRSSELGEIWLGKWGNNLLFLSEYEKSLLEKLQKEMPLYDFTPPVITLVASYLGLRAPKTL
jgi:hypothetical protein